MGNVGPRGNERPKVKDILTQVEALRRREPPAEILSDLELVKGSRRISHMALRRHERLRHECDVITITDLIFPL